MSASAAATPPTQTSSQCPLHKNYSALVRQMDGRRILKHLVQDGIISIEKQRGMKEEARTTEVLNEKIIDVIVRKGGLECAAAVQSLCSALRQEDVKQDHLADLLVPVTTTHTSGASPCEAQTKWQSPYNIVLLGRTGNGKSATGNSIVGNNVFNVSKRWGSETTTCDNAKACIDGYILNVIDTPGFADTSMPYETIVEEISKVHVLAHGGIHAVILVFRPDCRLTEEEKMAYNSLIQKFQTDILKHVIILYTHGDDFEEEALKDLINDDKNPKWFKGLLRQVKNRYLIFDNRTNDQDTKDRQRHRLLDMIRSVMTDTDNKPYNNKYTKMVSSMIYDHDKTKRASRQGKKPKVTSASTNQTAGAVPKTPKAKANPQKPRADKKSTPFVPNWTQKISKKKKNDRRGKQQEKRRHANISSQDVTGKSTTVPGRVDDDPTGQWTVSQSRWRKTHQPAATNVQSQAPSSPSPTREPSNQSPRNVATRMASKDEVGAAVAVPGSGDVSNQPQPPQPEGKPIKPEPVTIEIHQKIDEVFKLFEESDEHQKKVIMQKLKDELNKDTERDCFPASSVLVTASADEVPLSSVSVGEDVRVSADTFEPVFIFSHALEDVLSTYIDVTTEKGKTVSLSQSHFITISRDGERVTVPAREIKEGDKVFSVEESTGCLTPDKVVDVHYALKSGQYCPHTYSGSLIVDGVYVSCYTDKLPLALAHGLLLPLGWLHRTCPRLFRLLCVPEETGGVPWWMGKLEDMLAWWRSR
ncbi:uncharacterized protein LOC118409038 [Branchiostoma floridae]|uniref:Uncharacterized protein LOC118409038 n=2 Tax=Branchiostoma floridae TaxID=7739 RepID=A0A9J7HTW1_BRAFL|nr:uncharacterized protein LOC118409038 [Branchiostoma floridae]